jgi:membrane-bound metal-dependent hydrolase YbcI (DUF457 family)
MADFRTHITVSTICGVVYSVAGFRAGVPWESCVIAGGLCSVSGMLPDLDSDSGVPLREAVALSSAVIPMLLVDRLERMNMTHEMMVLITAGLYLGIRFGVAEFFRRYTVHRGMWHSIPAAMTCGMLAFLICASENMSVRLFCTMAVVIGFMSHLILDEMWSVDFKRGQYKFKSSFGTAIKFWGRERVPNLVAYALLAILAVLVYQDQGFMAKFGYKHPEVPHTASQAFQHLWQDAQSWFKR